MKTSRLKNLVGVVGAVASGISAGVLSSSGALAVVLALAALGGCFAHSRELTSYDAVCENLARLGCYEGADPDCAAVIGKAQSEGLTDLKPACLEDARSVGEVQACGTVSCTEEVGATSASCRSACSNLARLGCPEATDCLAACSKAAGEHLTDLRPSCLAKAKTKAAARACGSVSCQ